MPFRQYEIAHRSSQGRMVDPELLKRDGLLKADRVRHLDGEAMLGFGEVLKESFASRCCCSNSRPQRIDWFANHSCDVEASCDTSRTCHIEIDPPNWPDRQRFPELE